jgi:hypothetical protein
MCLENRMVESGERGRVCGSEGVREWWDSVRGGVNSEDTVVKESVRDVTSRDTSWPHSGLGVSPNRGTPQTTFHTISY